MSGFHHEALFYRDARDFLDGTLPFVREGLAGGERVMVAVPEPNRGRLKWALGSDAERVLWVDMTALGRNPACILPAWQEFLATQGSDGRAALGASAVWAAAHSAGLVAFTTERE